MLVKRLLVTIILLPVGISLVALGGIPYLAMMTLFLGIAAWEYTRLFRLANLAPSEAIVVGGTLLLTVSRHFWGFRYADFLLTLLVLAAITIHLIDYELGRSHAATDFAVTLGGLVYVGWLGAYLISLRGLPNGLWWFMLVLPATWLADAGAYFVGSRFGRHPMTPRLSPRKTWEGYAGSIAGGILSGILFAALWGIAMPALTLIQGFWIGLVMGILPTLGDLGESMIKRQVGAKDSSNILPGHGGLLDRMDSWLWAAPIGFYMISLLWIK